MATPLESLLAISGSVSTSSTLDRLRIFRHEIPEIIQNSGEHFLCVRPKSFREDNIVFRLFYQLNRKIIVKIKLAQKLFYLLSFNLL